MGILEKMRLDGKKTFITGGARGIGKSIAIAFAECGADIAIVDLDYDEAQRTAEELKDMGVHSFAVKTDVTCPAGVDAMAQAIVKEFGTIDVAVCNAGICVNTPAHEMTYDEWKKVIDVNLTGVFLTAQTAGKVMIKNKKGSIINIASMSGHVVNTPQPQCAYNASKAGVIMLTKSMSVEWAPYNVRVNCISPGYIGTELIKTSDLLKPLIEKWTEISPLKRIGTPEELQAIAVYLAGDASSFTNGSDFVIDGAYTCI